MTTITINGGRTTLGEAIEILRELRENYERNTDHGCGLVIPEPDLVDAALDLAIAVLTEKAEVSPARRTDPATSHRAAPEEIKAGSAREKILLAAENFSTPLTARELSFEAGLGHQRSPWKRVSELVKAGFLKPVGIGIDTGSGAKATTYAITAKGRAACAGLRDRMGAS